MRPIQDLRDQHDYASHLHEDRQPAWQAPRKYGAQQKEPPRVASHF